MRLVTIIATLDSQGWITVPPVEIAVSDTHDGRPLPPRRVRVIPQYSPSVGCDTGSFLSGAVAEAVYDATPIGQETRVVSVQVQGAGRVRLAVDFAALD